MKCKRPNVTYFEIFPDAVFSVSADFNPRSLKSVDPKCIQETIRGLLDIAVAPKCMTIHHGTLCDRVILAMFDGLDVKRYNKFKEKLPNFVNISQNKFPVFPQAKEREGYLIPGRQTVLGFKNNKKIFKKYNNYEEMITPVTDLLDNGYPLHLEGMKIPEKPRCELYKLSILTEEQLADFSELPEETTPETREIIAIDCEMVETKLGSELARLSVTDFEGKPLLDQLFKPTNEILDYRTPFSGISEETLANVTVTPDQALKILSKYASRKTIIVGHSLENDFRSLKLIHHRCIDTALLYNSETNGVKKPSLFLLYKKYINKPFRANESGHDSYEDARAAMDLVNFSLKDQNIVIEQPKVPDFIAEMIKKHGSLFYAGMTKNIDFPDTDILELKKTESDDETLKEIVDNIANNDLMFAHFAEAGEEEALDDAVLEKCLEKYNKILESLIEALPKRTALIVYVANGNVNRIKQEDDSIPPMNDEKVKDEFLSIRQGLLWVHCSPTK
ncbi:exonuclease family protein [Trichomonas vaginalis G3]|uniref:Exonuclease family protein n=1 Tax=Trichomonas vaginalis (strain ATCC PRA-98 / G3) TaxID=412133 RepID=A2EBD2_TRIV3|nr:exonuclease protein [Trichomonas vaginalis G3]EAY10077.1 exonuclease family protein [Trichomonas vaginalis G3]KAI5528472.1 exonuclease protein [Trichomonas vaginalis G3]|eukprot:XP_001322300.1 exonuclease family protein [Trichomonas vaginalis G3]